MAGKVIVRHPTPAELPEVARRIRESGGVYVDVYRTPCWVAVDEGGMIGVLAAELIWQIEPLLLFPEITNKAVRRRAVYGLYRAAERWIKDPSRNITGVYRAFAMMRMHAVRDWAKAMGWLHQYKRAVMYIKDFKGE